VKRSDFRGGQRLGEAFRVQVSSPERFIDINITQAGDAALIQKKGLQPAFETGKPVLKNRKGKGVKERFRPQMGQMGLGVGNDQPTAEFAGIAKTEPPSVVEREDQAVMRGGWGVGECPVKLAGHTEMDEQIGAAGEMENDVFSPAFKGTDGLTLKRGDKTGGREGRDRAVPEDFDFAE
jgi:hypothetical protein